MATDNFPEERKHLPQLYPSHSAQEWHPFLNRPPIFGITIFLRPRLHIWFTEGDSTNKNHWIPQRCPQVSWDSSCAAEGCSGHDWRSNGMLHTSFPILCWPHHKTPEVSDQGMMVTSLRSLHVCCSSLLLPDTNGNPQPRAALTLPNGAGI